jgi:hypothetical protein
VLDGPSPVIIERLYPDYGSSTVHTVEQASSRAVVFRHGGGGFFSKPTKANTPVFMESVVGHPLHLENTRAFLRDINTEQGGAQKANVLNIGGTMWILGHKTEDYATKLVTKRGKTELLGATHRQNKSQAEAAPLLDTEPLFVIEDAEVALSFVSWANYAGAPNYKIVVRERRGSTTRDWIHGQFGGTGRGASPLFLARP